MITLKQYFGKFQSYPEALQYDHQANAVELLRRVNALLAEFMSDGYPLPTNSLTACCIGGESFGGFRPLSCPIGALQSAHKTAEAVDIFDPANVLDIWLDSHPEVLEQLDLYREDPLATKGWCHLSIHRPASGHRTFFP